MNRRKFIETTCTACLSATVLTGLLSSCMTTKYSVGKLGTDGLFVDTDDFKIPGKTKDQFHSFIIVRNDALLYPVCIYRFSDTEYSAVWMRCTHQGAVLQASGDSLQCPAHGSAFSNNGRVTNGPADKDLRSFPVTVSNKQLFIDMRKA